jgi:hypothetical protein
VGWQRVQADQSGNWSAGRWHGQLGNQSLAVFGVQLKLGANGWQFNAGAHFNYRHKITPVKPAQQLV